MSQTISPSSKKRYGVARVVAVWGLPRSSFYAALNRRDRPQPPRKGPQQLPDAEIAIEIHKVIHGAPFVGEGYRKVWARLRHRGVRVWKERVLRIMRQNGLLSPSRLAAAKPTNPHDGTIVTERPNQIWGTDGTSTVTAHEGKVTVFAAIDHCTAECVGIHVVKKAHRFEALEPIRQGVREQFGEVRKGAVQGILLRHDHGSVYMSTVFQDEIRHFGFESSPSFVRQPEGNGCIERFFRTLKEQLLWIRDFHDIEELRLALNEFRERHNRGWILQKLGYRTPVQARRDFTLALTPAA